MQLVSEVIDEGNGEAVLDGDVVEGSVVNAHTEFSTFFLDEDDRGAIWGEAGFDRTIPE
jgi:hypothetical protein